MDWRLLVDTGLTKASTLAIEDALTSAKITKLLHLEAIMVHIPTKYAFCVVDDRQSPDAILRHHAAAACHVMKKVEFFGKDAVPEGVT
jgi:hypothetical protein